MDTLVALGSTTAFGYSVWALFTGAPGHLYFMESAAIITLISLGHWVEARTSARAESSLQALLRLAPAMARRRNPDGSETVVPVGELQINDVAVLKPGDHVPVDGEVIEGDSTVDESMLTGESLPVDKTPGDKLYAGTVNLNGPCACGVTATGEATALAHIIAAVHARAKQPRGNPAPRRPREQRVRAGGGVDRAGDGTLVGVSRRNRQRHVSGWLAQYLWPVSLPESALAAAFIHAAAVLIIACPCAMGLATPVAIMAGTNAAARRGILIRDGVALERAGRITAVIFDKTGTLTQGKPVVVEQETFASQAGRPAMDEIKLAAALARPSNHPISQAVARLGPGEFPLADWQEVRGAGVQAKLRLENFRSAPLTVRLGSLRWLRESGVDLQRGAAFEKAWSERGGTLLGIAADQWLLGMLAVEDTLKPGAGEVVRQLQAPGPENLISSPATTRSRPGPSPAKSACRSKMFLPKRGRNKKRSSSTTCRNKANASRLWATASTTRRRLEAADLGIAVSRASDVAREAADIILLKSEIQAVPEALGLARATLRTIKQNLFWAFFYNVAGIPLAALGFLSPILCALAMGLSDVVVIGNALRLLRWKLPPRQ